MDKIAFLKYLKMLRSLRKAVPKGVAGSAGGVLSMPRKAPEWFTKGIRGVSNPDKAYRAYRAQSMRSGDESLLLWPARAIASKVLPKKHSTKIKSLMWDALGAPALKVDTAVGNVLSKTPLVGKKLFRIKEDVPWGKGLKKEVERSSALAPLVKARDIAEPILVGVGLEKGIKKLEKMRQGQDMDDQQLRTKVASAMLHLHEKNKEHEKRAYALKLLYKQAELGLASLPQSFSELETKLASLANEDLVVLEKALELSGGNMKLGELGRNDSASAMSPAAKFQAIILGDEL
jgi:hypothetical protein